jgi:hypothetical protein
VRCLEERRVRELVHGLRRGVPGLADTGGQDGNDARLRAGHAHSGEKGMQGTRAEVRRFQVDAPGQHAAAWESVNKVQKWSMVIGVLTSCGNDTVEMIFVCAASIGLFPRPTTLSH